MQNSGRPLRSLRDSCGPRTRPRMKCDRSCQESSTPLPRPWRCKSSFRGSDGASFRMAGTAKHVYTLALFGCFGLDCYLGVLNVDY